MASIEQLSLSSTATIRIDVADIAGATARQRQLIGDMPPLPGFTCAVHWRGQQGVSGDFYDAWAMPDGRVMLALGDVSGHGIGAAMLTASILKSLRIHRHAVLGASDLMLRVCDEVSQDFIPGDFVTLWLVEITPGGDAVAVSAGHHAAAIIGDGSARRVDGTGPAIGIFRPDRFDGTPFRLEQGDWLCQCSDGVLEASSPSGELFGEERFVQTLVRLRSEGISVQALPRALASTVSAWCGTPSDDLTILVLERKRYSRADVPVHKGRQSDSWTPPPRSLDPKAGDYRLGRVIGTGASGVVHEALQSELGRIVAIKRSLDGDRSDPLRRESVIAAAVEHPNILPVHEVGTDPQLGPFIAMRRPQGMTWRSCIDELGLDRNLEILLAVADAVACAHRNGIIHRDVKPDNVLLGDDGAVYLFDWGIAACTSAATASLRSAVVPPEDGQAVGTPAYMSPEMARGDASSISPASDVYLLGAVLYEILTGAPPHVAPDIATALARAGSGTPLVIDPAEPLASVVHAACAPCPGERPADAHAFRAMFALRRRDRQALLMAQTSARTSEAAGDDLGRHLRALALAEEASRLCPGSTTAEVLASVQLAYAKASLAQGDVALARSLLQPGRHGHRELLAAIALVEEERRRDAARLQELESIGRRTGRQWLRVESHGDWLCSKTTEYRIQDGISTWTGTGRVAVTAPWTCPGDFRMRLRLRCGPNPRAGAGVAFSCVRDVPGVLAGEAYTVVVSASDTVLFREGVRVAATTERRLVPGHWFDLTVTRIGSALDITIDGNGAIRWNDPEPLAGSQRDAIILLGFEGLLSVSSCSVERHGYPEVEDLLTTASRQLGAGRQQTAIDLLDEVISSASGERHQSAVRLRARAVAEAEMARRHAHTADILARGIPGSRLTVRDGKLMAYLPEGCSDLAPLAGLPLGGLSAYKGTINDLAPLVGMPLVHVHLGGQRIRNIAALAELPLQVLDLNDSPCGDLSALSGGCLQELHISKTDVASLAPLRGHPLRHLNANCKLIADISALRGMPLEEAWLGGASGLVRIDALSESPVSRIGLTGTAVADLAPLRGLPLRAAFLNVCQIQDLTPLSGSPLRYLNIGITRVTDLGPLEGCPLEELVITGCDIRSVAAIAGCPLRKLTYGPCVPSDLDRVPRDCQLIYRARRP